jgi:hypothetical protein
VTQSPSSTSSLIEDTTSLSDDFYGTALDAGLWTFQNPLADAILSVGNSELTIVVPGGIKHEAWTSGNSAPRVMQNVDPSMNVNTWTVRFNTLPVGSPSAIPFQGMFFEQDALNYVRVDIFSDGTGVYAFAAGFLTGPSDPHTYFSIPIAATQTPVWICVTRSGSLWRVYISLDGVTSFVAGSFDHLMTLQRVGPYAGNAGTAPAEFTCLVDYFQGALPARPFPVTPEGGAIGVSRPVIFAWDSSTAATSYQLQVAADSNFGAVLFDSTVSGTSTTVNSLQTSQECWWRVKAGNSMGWSQFSDKRWFIITTTGIQEGDQLPYTYSLEQNYPNPFNPTTSIKYTVAGTRDQCSGIREAGLRGQGPGVSVKLTVYDLLGREVAVLVDENKAPGSYQATFDGSSLSSGLYLYRMTANSFVQTKKMLLIK